MNDVDIKTREYTTVSEVAGPLMVVQGVEGAAYNEIVEIETPAGENRTGQVLEVKEDIAVVQVFEGTSDLNTESTKVRFTGETAKIGLSTDMLGRIFNGIGKPIDGGPDIIPDQELDVNGSPMNPSAREFPAEFIQTGISTIDGMNTLVRGQKLPIFSGSGLPHNQLAVQIVKQAKIADEAGQGFAVVFAAMGVTNDVANYFRRSFEEAGVMQRVVMFMNLSNDPIIERILTPRCALTAAEYLAFEHDMHVLVIYTDVTSYCEALREFSSSKGEIPGRKGYPGYLYSDLASLYERAGIAKGAKGSVTQIPILTMPNNDITHPVPDLTGYITEGQITLDPELNATGIYPPVGVLPSLSRLMKDGIGEGFTRADHQDVANQLFACYAHVQDVKSLTSVIGEDELSEADKKYMEFGRLFEQHFLNQGFDTNRSIEETLDLGWLLLSVLPKNTLDRIDNAVVDKFYDHEKAVKEFNLHEDVVIKELKDAVTNG